MIRAALVSNEIVGLHDCFQANDRITYDFLPLGEQTYDFRSYDLLIVPNGSDQIALGRLQPAIQAYLNTGRTLFCFDGWFTDWVPGNQWVMDNRRKTIDVRYRVKTDRYGLFEGINLDAFNFSNGISGWWACGYIRAAERADIVLEDTWQRPIIVLDEHSSPGRLFLTASGPLGDFSYATTDDDRSIAELGRFYQRLLERLVRQPISTPA